MNTRAVRKVASHSEFFENRSRGLDLIGSQSEETLLCIREQLPSCGTSQSAVSGPLTEFVYV